MSKPVHVTDAEFEKEVLQADVPVLVDFWAEWCGPCRMVAPSLETLAEEYDGRFKVAKVDTNANPEWASRFGVQVRVNRPRCGGAMGRAVDQGSLFRKLLPLFSSRLNSSALAGRGLAASISTELGTTTIAYDGEHVSLEEGASKDACELSAPALMQLVTGYRDPLAVGAKFSGKRARAAMKALWPRQEAFMWRADHF